MILNVLKIDLPSGLPNKDFTLHKVSIRILASKCFGDKFEMLVTDSTSVTNNITVDMRFANEFYREIFTALLLKNKNKISKIQFCNDLIT